MKKLGKEKNIIKGLKLCKTNIKKKVEEKIPINPRNQEESIKKLQAKNIMLQPFFEEDNTLCTTHTYSDYYCAKLCVLYVEFYRYPCR